VNSDHAPRWIKWWQDDIPCQYSPNDAVQHAAFLTELLGSSFLEGANHPLGQVKHPILRRWKSSGAGAFLELNALASDLKIIANAAGFETVLHDLRNTSTCLATWHTIHVAALLGRGSESEVTQFFPQTDESAPDFLVVYQGESVACEAKLLAESGPQEAFGVYASELSHNIIDNILTGESMEPTVIVVLKDVSNLPSMDDVAMIVARHINEYSGTRMEHRSSAVNVFLDPPESATSEVTESRRCLIFCPKSDKEDLRVQRPGSKASKQLLSGRAGDYPGILLLGITDMQDPGYVVSLFRKTFKGGRFSGISGVLLIHSGIHLQEPMRAPLDLVALVRNDLSPVPHPNLFLVPVGLLAKLPTESSEDVPAYRHCAHVARVGRGGRITMPDIRTLTSAMLADGALS
jgi:hypothetical protein